MLHLQYTFEPDQTQRSDSELTCLPQGRRGRRRHLGSAIVLAGCAGGRRWRPVRRPRRADHAHHRHVQRLRLHRRAPPGVHGREPERHHRPQPCRRVGDARANYFQKLGKAGLADIEAVEIDWFAEAMQYSDLLAEVPDSVKGRWLDWKEAGATDADGRLVGLRHRHRAAGHLLPRRPVRGRRAPVHARRGRRAVRRRLGQLLRGGRPVQGGDRQADDRLGELGAPGHREPDRVHLHRARRHRHRDREPRGRGRLQPRRRAGRSRTRPTRASGPTTGTRRWPTASSPRCCARAGCSASSRATRPTSPAGTSPTSSRTAAATGAGRT